LYHANYLAFKSLKSVVNISKVTLIMMLLHSKHTRRFLVDFPVYYDAMRTAAVTLDGATVNYGGGMWEETGAC